MSNDWAENRWKDELLLRRPRYCILLIRNVVELDLKIATQGSQKLLDLLHRLSCCNVLWEPGKLELKGLIVFSTECPLIEHRIKQGLFTDSDVIDRSDKLSFLVKINLVSSECTLDDPMVHSLRIVLFVIKIITSSLELSLRLHSLLLIRLKCCLDLRILFFGWPYFDHLVTERLLWLLLWQRLCFSWEEFQVVDNRGGSRYRPHISCF